MFLSELFSPQRKVDKKKFRRRVLKMTGKK